MEHFGRWIKANSEKRVGTSKQVIGILAAMLSVIALLVTGGLISDGLYIWAGVAFIIALLLDLAWIPYLQFKSATQHQDRYRGEFKRVAMLQATGKLAEEVGAKGEILETAAQDWETLSLLVERRTVPDELAKEIQTETDGRMDRIFDLSFHPPAFYGLSQTGAEAQIALDQEWLAKARAAMEDATLTGDALTSLAEDPLLRLHSLAIERENARAELRA
ncbi:hypothetical protein BH11ARM2_BH11ARM2_23970 [soil metagenome]